MADDDLDAFFDEVSAVEAEVKQELVEDEDKDDKRDSQSHVEPSAKVADKDSDHVQPPPAKKQKVSARKPPKRPLGVVVASSTPVASANAVPAASAPATTVSTTSLATPSATTVFPSPTSLPSPSIPAVGPQPPSEPNNGKSNKPHKRAAAGKVWVDTTLDEWPENDYRLFVGNLSKDVSDQSLYEHFAKYPSLAMVKVVRDAQGASKGYGFVSLLEPMECARAIREMDQTWLSSRPIRVKRSDWKERELKSVRQKKKKMTKKQRRMGF